MYIREVVIRTAITLANALFILAPVSFILWLIDRFIQPFLPDTINNIIFLISPVVSIAVGILIFISIGYKIPFRLEGLTHFTNRLLDGVNGKSFGEIQVDSKEKTYEVFYKKPYARPPSLRILSDVHYEIIEQRSDGFKIKGYAYGNSIIWEAKGEFIDTKNTHKTPSFSYSIFGAPNKKYTYDLFILMPFASHLKPVYDDHIKDVAKTLNLSIARADDFFSQNSIMYEVWSAITQASILIADCTGKNPNVFYEIGIAHTIGKPVILITQEPDDVPFDLRHIRYIHYEYSVSGMIKFKSTLKATILEIMKDIGVGK